ncbi:MAG: DNA starvation/stationary phase protection protein, partial [Pseudomonadota bacterium]
WNVTGMAFGPLHTMFQEIYEDHFVAQDDLAERVKALDGHAEGMLAGMLKRSKVSEHDGHASDQEMVKALQVAQETLAATLAGAGELAANHGDTLTEDLCIARGQTHEKFAWMLRSHLR